MIVINAKPHSQLSHLIIHYLVLQFLLFQSNEILSFESLLTYSVQSAIQLHFSKLLLKFKVLLLIRWSLGILFKSHSRA